MTPEERDLIADLFARLKAVDSGPKDLQADAAIRDAVARNPAAPYLLVQTVLVQEHALKGAEARIAELERQLADAQQAAAQPGGGGSFLGGLLGGRASQAPTGGPWGRRIEPGLARSAPTPSTVYQAAPAAAGGGFLRSALSTAAGVAGGALLFEGIERMLGYGSGPFGSPLGGGWGGNAGYAPVVEREETIVNNNYYGDSGGGSGPDISDASDNSNAQDYDDGSSDSGGFDSGGSTDI
jgi:hypothetical protein